LPTDENGEPGSKSIMLSSKQFGGCGSSRRAMDWRRTALRNLVAVEAHGELRPAHNAQAA
jgi:hypothetical protein